MKEETGAGESTWAERDVMQTWTDPQRMHMNTPQPARKIMSYTILCFSLAGLIFGFAVGGFVGRGPQTPTSHQPPPITHRTPSSTVTASPTPENVQLDQPIIKHVSDPEKADGVTSYTLSAQAVYKGTLQPITVNDVVCRLWLTTDLAGTQAAYTANSFQLLRNIDGLNQPFPLETIGGLTFTSTSAQVQPCNSNGPTSWTYTVAPTVPPGTYYLFVLTDWKGRHFNTFARQITITQ